MIEKHGMKLFYGFFVVLFVGMFALSQIDAKAPEAIIEIEADDANTFVMDINIPVGTLNIEGGATHLMDAEFLYENHDATLLTNYSEVDDVGTLRVYTDDPAAFSDLETNAFTIHLSENAPIDLTVDRERGNTTLHLDAVRLNHLAVRLGNGHNNVRLRGNYPTLLTFTYDGNRDVDLIGLDGAFASLDQLRVDTNAGGDDIRLAGEYPELNSFNASMGAGEDVVSVGGSYDRLITATIDLGTGNDIIVLQGIFPVVSKFTINVSTGNDIIDLSQRWDHSLEIEVISEADSSRLYLPVDVPTAVRINSVADDITVSTRNMRQVGELWVNDEFSEDDNEVLVEVIVNTSSVETVELIAGPPDSPLLPDIAASTEDE